MTFKQDLHIVKADDIFTLIAHIAMNLTTIETHIEQCSDQSKKELLTTLKGYTKLYQWLTDLLANDKIHLGNHIDKDVWIEDLNIPTGNRDIRIRFLS